MKKIITGEGQITILTHHLVLPLKLEEGISCDYS